MSNRNDDESEDRRALERRWQDRMDSRVGSLEERAAKTETRLDMFLASVNSRYGALERGQATLAGKIDALEALKDRLVGAYALVMFLGVSGLIGMIVAIVKLAKVP